jgi:phage tail sheath gpL-like
MGQIVTGIPSTRRRPGNFQIFNYKAASRGLVPIQARMAICASRKAASGTQADLVPIQVFDEATADLLWGVGSEMALGVRAAMKMSRAIGQTIEIWGVSTAEPATAAQFTLTITGAATSAGNIRFRIAGRTYSAGVAISDSVTVMALAVKAEIDKALADLPVTAGAAVGVVTLTAVVKGVNGNDIVVEYLDGPAGVAVAVAASVAGAGTYDLTAALDTLKSKQFHALAVANHLANDVSDIAAHQLDVNDPAAQLYSIAFMAEPGTLGTGTTLALAAQNYALQIIGARKCPQLPIEIASMVAMANFAVIDPVANFDGFPVPIYPPYPQDAFTPTEQESLLGSGVTPLLANEAGTGSLIGRSVSTKTTESSVPFEALLDLSNTKGAFYGMKQTGLRLKQAFSSPDAKIDANAVPRVITELYNTAKSLEALGVYRNVDDHKQEFRAVIDEGVATRIDASVPDDIVPNLHQIAVVHNLIVGVGP